MILYELRKSLGSVKIVSDEVRKKQVAYLRQIKWLKVKEKDRCWFSNPSVMLKVYSSYLS